MEWGIGVCHVAFNHASNEKVIDLGRVGAGPLTAENQGQARQDIRLGRTLGLEDRGRVVGYVADREVCEGSVVMAALQEGRGRQDDVGVTTRFVAVDVDADHEFKIFEGGLEATRIRRRESGVSPDREEGSDLPLSGFFDLVGQGRDGKLAHHLGKVPDAAPPATGFEAPAPRSFSGSGTRGPRKHRPTGPIEFACQNIQYIRGPRGQGAKPHRVNTDSSVDDPALGMGQFSGQSPDDGRVHTAALGHPLGRKGLNGYAHLFEAVYVIGNVR